ncbi:MAG: C4-dicarboxylate transporter DctA [Gemmatimonadaceae bacterium]|nr:C4-dicarboxylate transporter DctA [Gemmatimonadaceae bacterium]
MRRLASNLTVQVLTAVALGVLFGVLDPEHAKAMKVLGDAFIKLVKMVIGPVIFLTIVLGIAQMEDLKQVGKVGLKAFVYFEVVTTFALGIGLVIVNLTKPGAGLDATKLLPPNAAAAATGKSDGIVEFLLHIIPTSPIDAFARGDLLQIVFFAVLFGVATSLLGDATARPLVDVLDRTMQVFFKIVGIVMVVAPIGAFGAMAYTVGSFGLATLLPLLRLMADVYLTMAVFIFVVLGLIARAYRIKLWELMGFIREEILIVLGTSSSEAALPRLMDKLQRYGCSRSVVGLVVPAGYSFNLDGTSIYLSMAAIFLAQVYGIDLSIGQQLFLLAILMITSKGAAGVTGSGFIVLTSTLAATKVIPVEGAALLLAVDRFMSEARAITNLIGNAVATCVLARSEGQFDDTRREQSVRALATERAARG